MPLTGIALFALALIALSLVGCVYLGVSVWAVRRLRHLRPRRAGDARPVSILKPLCGEDPDLTANLRSFCSQDYPEYQVVFGVRDADDPAIAIVRGLMAEFPGADLTLVIDPRRRGRNLKVANLLNMLPASRHDILVIADSDMRVEPGYLAGMSAPLADPAVGLVTCLYRGVPAGGIWSTLRLSPRQSRLPAAGSARRGDRGGRGVLRRLDRAAARHAGAYRRSWRHRRRARRRLCAGRGGAARRRAHRAGRRIWSTTSSPSRGWRRFIRHELRWARTIRLVAPMGFLGSIVTQPVAVAAVAVALGRPAGRGAGDAGGGPGLPRRLGAGHRPPAAPAARAAATCCRCATCCRLRYLSLVSSPDGWHGGIAPSGLRPSGQITLDGDSPA